MGNHRVQKFDTSSNVLPQLLTKWGGGLGPGHASSAQAQEPGQFRSPWGISIEESGDVLISDTGNQRIQKFDRMETSSPNGVALGPEPGNSISLTD
jgi:tripartite motif-containing protein 71